MTSPSETMKRRLRADLKAAMQNRDALETSVLRSLMAAIDNAQAVPVDPSGPASRMRSFGDGAGEVARLALSDEELAVLLEREAALRDAASAEMRRLGRGADAERFVEEAAVVRKYCGA